MTPVRTASLRAESVHQKSCVRVFDTRGAEPIHDVGGQPGSGIEAGAFVQGRKPVGAADTLRRGQAAAEPVAQDRTQHVGLGGAVAALLSTLPYTRRGSQPSGRRTGRGDTRPRNGRWFWFSSAWGGNEAMVSGRQARSERKMRFSAVMGGVSMVYRRSGGYSQGHALLVIKVSLHIYPHTGYYKLMSKLASTNQRVRALERAATGALCGFGAGVAVGLCGPAGSKAKFAFVGGTTGAVVCALGAYVASRHPGWIHTVDKYAPDNNASVLVPTM
jgi:hypothetical protein